MGHLDDEDRAGRADGVAMCDRTAIDAEARRINLQFVAHDDSNRRMTVISVVVGSMRQGRLSEKPAQWILQHLKKRGGIDARLPDLRGVASRILDCSDAGDCIVGVGKTWMRELLGTCCALLPPSAITPDDISAAHAQTRGPGNQSGSDRVRVVSGSPDVRAAGER